MLHLGQTFFNKPAPDVPRHCWIILSRPEAGPKVAIVNLSSTESDRCTHNAVAIERSELVVIGHRSVVRCDKVRLASVAELGAALTRKLIEASKDTTPEVLRRVQLAVAACELVPND